MRYRTCWRWAVLAAAGIPWGFVAAQQDLPGFDRQVHDRVLEILPELRDEDWWQLESDPSRQYFGTMLNKEVEAGEPVYFLLLIRDEVVERRGFTALIPQNLRLVDESGALAHTTLQWREYTFKHWQGAGDWKSRIIKWPEAREHRELSPAGMEVQAYELSELFDLSCAGTCHLQVIPTFESHKLPIDPDFRLSFRVLEPQEE